MKELKLEELTTRQKLGMTMTALMTGTDEENVEYVLGLIRDHALGAVWINWPAAERNALLAKVKETADYPILAQADLSLLIFSVRLSALPQEVLVTMRFATPSLTFVTATSFAVRLSAR